MDGGFLAGPERVKVNGGELRLLSAREVLEARREGDALALDGKERAVCDYIAGMTDAYAVETYLDLFIPKSWSVK